MGCPLFWQLSNFKLLTPRNGSPRWTDKPEFFLHFLLDGKAWWLERNVPNIAIREKNQKFFFLKKNVVSYWKISVDNETFFCFFISGPVFKLKTKIRVKLRTWLCFYHAFLPCFAFSSKTDQIYIHMYKICIIYI